MRNNDGLFKAVLNALKNEKTMLDACFLATSDNSFDTARHFVTMAIEELERAAMKNQSSLRGE
jgi:hypothetical protein